MTLKEAYDKALRFGDKVSVTASMQTLSSGKPLEYYSLQIDSRHVVACKSYTDAFKKIGKIDPAKTKADKIAKLKAELLELDS
jgi:hypothetical protein